MFIGILRIIYYFIIFIIEIGWTWIKAARMGKEPAFHKMAVKWARAGLKVIGAKINLSGLENIPASKPLLFVANYQHDLDTCILLAALPFRLAVTAGHTFFVFPLNLLTKPAGFLPLEQKNLAVMRADTNQILNKLRKGDKVSIFLNLHPNRTDQVGEPVTGPAMLALRTNTPIIPIAIDGSYLLFKRNLKDKNIRNNPITVNIRIGKPIEIQGFENDQTGRLNLTQKIKEEIQKLMLP